jgi:uncharacterized membrane protein
MFSKKRRQEKTNANFEYAKTLAGEGSILLLLSIVPYAGWILGIIGAVLLVRAMKELSSYYQDETIYQDTLTGIKFYIIALVAAGVAIAALVIGIGTATGFKYTTHFTPTPGFGAGLVIFLGGIIVAFIFYLLATSSLRKTFNTLAEKSGEKSFKTAGKLLWWGAILTIVFVGLILIFIAWIFAAIGFFTMKSRQYQQYTAQPNGNFPPVPPPPIQATKQPANITVREGGI